MNQFEKETTLWTIEKLVNDVIDIGELKTIRNLVTSRIKNVAKDNAYSLVVGETVKIAGSGKIQEGVIKKINRTRAVIMVGNVGWNVPFEMIRKENNDTK